jgi:hypothetical protein
VASLRLQAKDLAGARAAAEKGERDLEKLEALFNR